jgi:hypothetical protein
MRTNLINTHESELDVVENNRDCDDYTLEIEDRWCDGTAVVHMTRSELRELGQELIDYANEREASVSGCPRPDRMGGDR